METRELERANVLAPHPVTPWSDRLATADGELPRRSPSSFPPGAQATIYRPARSAMTSGQASTRHWILEFEARSPLFVEPLMGWTGGADPLRHLRFIFPSRTAAIAYARRQGLRVTTREAQEQQRSTRGYANNLPADPAGPVLHAARRQCRDTLEPAAEIRGALS
jgi:ETC complex I subunit conserved region